MNITPLRAKLLAYLMHYVSPRRRSAQLVVAGCDEVGLRVCCADDQYNNDDRDALQDSECRNIFRITEAGRKAWRDLPPPVIR